MSETWGAALARGAATLDQAGISGAARDARTLLGWAGEIEQAHLSARLSEPADGAALARYASALHERLKRKPVSHIVGGRLFWGRWFEVSGDVLDPRPETEIMIAAALDGPGPRRVLDLGTGSGCILGTILAEKPGARGLGIDASEAALSVAARNMECLGVADQAELRRGDWLTGVEGRFDLVLCNPPYIAAAEMAGLSPEVSGFEPHMALTPGGDGLDPYRAIAPRLGDVILDGGRAMFEIGPTQEASAAAPFIAAGWPAPEILRDFDGRPRCLSFVKADLN